MAPTIFRLMLLLGIGLAAVDVAEAGAMVITTMKFPNETFTSDLLNSTTIAYQNLTARIEDKVLKAMQVKNADIIGLKVNGYTNGSIVVNATVELHARVDPATVNTAQLVKNVTTAVANDATFTAFKIDSSSITTTAQQTTTTAAPGATTAANTTAATGSNTTTAAASGTTAAPAGSASNTTTAAAAAGSGSNTTTAAAAAGSGSNTTTAAAAAAGSGSNTTTAAAAAAGSGSTNTTVAAAGSGATTAAPAASTNSSATSGANTTTSTTTSGTNTTTSRPNTSTSATTRANTTTSTTTSGTNTTASRPNTTTSATTSGTAGASGTAGSSSNGTAGSTASTVNTTARIPVKVDETSLGGMGVIITITKTALPSVAPYLDITRPEYSNLMGALPALNNMLKGTSETANILSNVELKQVIAEDSATIRVEYVAKVAKETTLAPLQAGMDALNKKDVFKIDGTTHKVEFVPLTVPNRWHSLRLRLPSKIFTPEMKDPSFAQFKSLQIEIQGPLSDLLRAKVPAVRAVYIQEFISGSVIVRASVETDNTSSSATTSNLANALSTVDNVGTYNVDTDAKTKSVTGETYIYGAHTVQPVPESQLPVRIPLTRDTENIKKGQVSIEDPNVNQVAIKRTNYFFTVTIPSFAAVLVLIILFLCCTTSDSCLCKICSNEPKNVP